MNGARIQIPEGFFERKLARNSFDQPSQPKVPIVALTGGPCGGKATLMRELRAKDPECRRWVLVPEAAPLLFQAGLDAREPGFQVAVVRLQLSLEDACALAANPGCVLVCHRGTLDALAYWLGRGWKEAAFVAVTDLSRDEHQGRYTGVLHLQSPPLGWNAATNGGPTPIAPRLRSRPPAWTTCVAGLGANTPNYTLLDNCVWSWAEKSSAAWKLLNQLTLLATLPERTRP